MKKPLNKANSLQAPSQMKEEESLGQHLSPPPFQLMVDTAADPPADDGSSSGNGGNNTGMPDGVKSKMEGSFGQDFSDVKIDSNSDKASQMGAQAYAQGNNIGFAPGKYNPESGSGQALLGHELSHVVQQREGRVQPTTQAKSGDAVNDNAGLEKEADDQGAKAARGEKVAAPSGASQMSSRAVQKSTDYDAIAKELLAELTNSPSTADVVKIMTKIPPSGGFDNLRAAYNKISKIPVQRHLKQSFPKEEDYNRVMESVIGMSVAKTTTGAVAGNTGPSLFNLRAGPNGSATVIGKLDGSNMPIVVTGKGTGSDLVWFKVKFKNTADYEKVTAHKKAEVQKGGDATAISMMAGQEAYVAESALNLFVEYDYFMGQIGLFDQMTLGMSLKAKITKLRQMCHGADLPFDTIIGTDSGNYFKDNRPDTHKFFQLLDSAQGVKTPNGEIIDMYHFIVGLDAYQKDRREDSSGTFLMGDVGASHAASTWSGDIGAGATDMVMKASEDMEGKLGSEEERLNFYYNSRAPESDLLADIDAWGAYEQIDNGTTSSLQVLINNYYGGQKMKSKAAFKSKRKLALENMFSQYGLKAESGSMITSDNLAKLNSQIYKFAKVWRKKRKGMGLAWDITTPGAIGAYFELAEIEKVSKKMAGKFLQMLEKLAKQNGVK